MTRRRVLCFLSTAGCGLLLATMLTSLVTNAAAQDQSTIDAKQQLSPGVSSLLLDGNAYYSAAMIDLPFGADTQIRQIKRDVVIAVVGGVLLI
jgi:hypothetical protein